MKQIQTSQKNSSNFQVLNYIFFSSTVPIGVLLLLVEYPTNSMPLAIVDSAERPLTLSSHSLTHTHTRLADVREWQTAMEHSRSLHFSLTFTIYMICILLLSYLGISLFFKVILAQE